MSVKWSLLFCDTKSCVPNCWTSILLYYKKIQMVWIEWGLRPFSEVTVQNVPRYGPCQWVHSRQMNIWIIVKTTRHKICLSIALSVTGATLTAFDLSWQFCHVEVTSMEHHGAKLTGSGKCSHKIPFEGHDIVSHYRTSLDTIGSMCSAPLWTCGEVWRCRLSMYDTCV